MWFGAGFGFVILIWVPVRWWAVVVYWLVWCIGCCYELVFACCCELVFAGC